MDVSVQLGVSSKTSKVTGSQLGTGLYVNLAILSLPLSTSHPLLPHPTHISDSYETFKMAICL